MTEIPHDFDPRLFWESMPKKDDGSPLSREEFHAFLKEGLALAGMTSPSHEEAAAFCEVLALAATPEEIANISFMAQADLAFTICGYGLSPTGQTALSSLFEKATFDPDYIKWRQECIAQFSRRIFDSDFLTNLAEKWGELDNEERRAGLEKVTALHAEIFGIGKRKITLFEEPAVINADGEKCISLALHRETGIGFNIHPDAFSEWTDINTTLEMLLHECTHHVQQTLGTRCIEDPESMSKTPGLLAQGLMFRLNFCHYVQPDPENHKPYEKQPIERDAFFFARETMLAIGCMRTCKRLGLEPTTPPSSTPLLARTP